MVHNLHRTVSFKACKTNRTYNKTEKQLSVTMVTDIKQFIVTIITQYIQILNHYVVHLKLIECMLIILQLKQNKTKQHLSLT